MAPDPLWGTDGPLSIPSSGTGDRGLLKGEEGLISLLEPPEGPCHEVRSLREVTNRGTSAPVKQSLSAARLGDGQLLGQVVEARDVVNTVLVHHAHQLRVDHLDDGGDRQEQVRGSWPPGQALLGKVAPTGMPWKVAGMLGYKECQGSSFHGGSTLVASSP